MISLAEFTVQYSYQLISPYSNGFRRLIKILQHHTLDRVNTEGIIENRLVNRVFEKNQSRDTIILDNY